jgi:hypothetical protein
MRQAEQAAEKGRNVCGSRLQPRHKSFVSSGVLTPEGFSDAFSATCEACRTLGLKTETRQAEACPTQFLKGAHP